MRLPEHGLSKDDVMRTLLAKRSADVRWQDGRTFGMVYDGGPSVHEVAEAVAVEFLHDNALNTRAFPSLGEIQSEVVGMCADLFHGATAAGFMTSGGTESILLAVKAARERGKAERGITEPEMVVAESAHAAFHKGAHYFGLRVNKVAVADDWRADVDAMAAEVNDNTVLVVGSAPQYPQGVIDPIPELAALAADVGASFHTDACMGGFVLPFMEQLGHDVPPWDFRVPGVTTISADVHKLGYAPKGASVIIHRDKELRRYQTFVFDDWLGGFYASPGMQGSRPGMPMATAWAVMQHLGLEGYRRLTTATIDARARMVEGIRAIPAVRVLGEPEAQIVAMASNDARLDVFALGDALQRRGWFHDRQSPPDSLHSTLCAANAPVVDDYLHDLAASVDEVLGTTTDDRSTTDRRATRRWSDGKGRHHMDEICSIDELRTIYRRPRGGAVDKQHDAITDHDRAFIGHAPFVVMATSDAGGRCDVSPKGGPPGFVTVLDDGRVAIPDLSGNNRLDSMQNMLDNPGIGLLFMIPGIDETLRVNGRARLSTDPNVLVAAAVGDVEPRVAIVVDVDEVFIHCAKALRRGSVWQPDEWPDTSTMPSVAHMLRDQVAPAVDVAVVEDALEDSYQKTLWQTGG